MKILTKWKRLATVCLLALGTQLFAEPTTRSAPEIDPPVVDSATAISSSGFTANWQAVTGATGYKLTVDDDITFNSPITGYDGLDVGNVTSKVVSTALSSGTPVYYRLTAYDSTEESLPSDTVTVILPYTINGAESGVEITTTATDRPISDLSSVTGVSGVTIECWMKLPATATNWTRLPMLDVGSTQIGFIVAPQGKLIVYTGGGNGQNRFSVGNLADDKWHHFAVTVNFAADGEAIPSGIDEAGRKATRIYVDGYNVFTDELVLESRLGSRNIDPTVNVGDKTYNATEDFGVLYNDFNAWTAGYTYRFDELRVWKDVRTQDEIRANMNRTNVTDANLVAYYKCDGTGSELTDATGNFSNTTFFNDANATRVDSYAHVLDATPVTGWNWSESVGAGSVTNQGLSTLKVESASLTDVQYAVSAAVNQSTATSTSNVPSGVTNRLEREWFFYQEGSATADLTFDVTGYGISNVTANAKLLYRANTSSDFTDTSVAASEVSSGVIKFSGVTVSEGYYTFGTTAAITLPPDAPVATAATSVSSSGFTANWQAATGATSYKLTVADNNSFTSPILDNVDVGNVLTYAVSTAMTSGVPLYYRLLATNSAGDSTASNVITVTYVAVLPDAPVATNATNVLNTGFTANWNASSGATGYKLTVDDNADFSSPIISQQDVGNNTSHQVNTPMALGVPVYYKVVAYNANGDSPDSNVISVVRVLQSPANFTATTASSSIIDLSWDAVADATSYKINAAYDAGFTRPVGGDFPVTVTGTSYKAQNLIDNQSHYFTIVSVSGANESSAATANSKTYVNAGTTDGVDYFLTTSFNAVRLDRWNTQYVRTEGAPVNFDNDVETSESEVYINNSVDFVAEVNASNTFEIHIGTSDTWSSGKVWVDWNHDGTFEDATTAEFGSGNRKELAGYFKDRRHSNAHWAAADPYINSEDSQVVVVTVPDEVDLAAVPFKTRIRIRTTDGGSGATRVPDAVKPDGYSEQGQLQDYGLFISDVLFAPPAPTWEATTGLSTTGFTLNWNGNSYTDGYYLTIATDSAFLNPITGYNRKELGAVSTEVVSTAVTTGIPLYCKISAFNDGGESSESEDLIVLLDAPASPDAGKMLYYPEDCGYQVNSTDFDPVNLPEFTYSSWLVAGDNSTFGAIFGFRNGNTTRIGMWLHNNAPGTRYDVGFGLEEDTTRTDLHFFNGSPGITLVNAVPTGLPVHVAVGVSDSVLNVYVNGKQIYSTTTYVGSSAAPGVVSFGYIANRGEGVKNTAVDEVAIWDKLLTEDDLKSIVNTKLTGSEDNLMLAYDFNDGSTATDITGNGYNGVVFNTPQYIDSNAVLVDTSTWASASVSWNGNLNPVDVGGMALANVEGINFNNTYVAYGPLKSGDSSDPGGEDSPADGETDDVVASPAPSADLRLTTRNLSNETDAQVRLKRLFEVREQYVEATADIVFDKRQLSVIFGTADTFRLIRRNSAGSGDFELVASTDPANNSTTVDPGIPATDYALGVEDNGYITFSSIDLEQGFYTLASSGTGLTPAFEMDVTQVGNKISWTVTDETGVDYYKVVSADGEFVAIVQKGKLYEVTLPNDEPATVTVVDLSGDTKVFSGGSDAEYNLQTGWNLISIPLTSADISDLKDKAVGGVWGWTGSAYELVESVNVTDAVWVYTSSEVSATVTGVKSEALIEGSLKAGWNMVGPTADCNVPSAAISVHAWKDVYSKLAKEKDQLHSREGYWIFCMGNDADK